MPIYDYGSGFHGCCWMGDLELPAREYGGGSNAVRGKTTRIVQWKRWVLRDRGTGLFVGGDSPWLKSLGVEEVRRAACKDRWSRSFNGEA